MGKKKQLLGRSLVREKNNALRGKRQNDSLLHTSELPDGYDWARLNVKSVTEEDSLQEFLSTAELAGTEFQAEKLNVHIVNPECGSGLLSNEEKSKLKEIHHEKQSFLKIPRRPQWNPRMSAEELHSLERESFLEWRRELAKLQEENGLIMSPFEKTLDFWRELWRVVEKSDIIVQILDARNPLLYYSRDLDKYVKEVDKNKRSVLLLNKSDFLTSSQRQAWARYFDSEYVQVAFFSAKNEAAELAALAKIDESAEEGKEAEKNISNLEDGALDEIKEEKEDEADNDKVKGNEENGEEEEEGLEEDFEDEEYETESEEEIDEETANRFLNKVKNSRKLHTRDSLLKFFKDLGSTITKNKVVTVGFVGYPNVGKSSTINALIQDKKTSVSFTPGKTKHFQTLFIDSELMLCDCPGLVMPSFVYTKADLVINGILSIDQMRDHVAPINLVCSLIPRYVLEDKYSIMIPQPMENEDQDRVPTSEEFLNAHGYSRGYMTQNGQPDNARSARYVLKDFVSGRLLHCYAPPNVPQNEFHKFPPRVKAPPPLTRMAEYAIKPVRVTPENLDQAFFKQASLASHIKGRALPAAYCHIAGSNRNLAGSTLSLNSVDLNEEKPWKNHKEKRNKKEKLRRVYRHLDSY